MYKSNLYTKLILLVSFMVLGFGSAYAQLELKLQLMDDDTWGVYVTPAAGVSPDSSTITGSGQVTVVMPTGFSWSGLTSVSGLWQQNATVVAPTEDPTRDYVSYGLLQAEPNYPIYYQAGEETLLFTFNRDGACPDTMFLIDCGTPSETDPFCPPNSVNSNPGNDLSVIQFSPSLVFYNYTDNYAPSAWSCQDCDGDGILNGLEDTNGNGVFDVGIDTSALCDPCDPIHVETATLNFVDGFDAICAGDAIDTAYMTVDIVGGWSPYTVLLDNGTTVDSFFLYETGDTIAVVPTASTVYTLDVVIDSFLCSIDPDSMFGSISIEVHGPISITSDPAPDPNVECSEDGTYFLASAANAGLDGTIFYKWQISSTGIGGTYTDVNDGQVYDGTDTDSLSIDPIAGLHGSYYRMKIWTEQCDTVFSTGALLQVEGPLSVTTDPVDFVVCDNSSATFSAAGANAGAVGTLQYQWQINDGTNGWLDVPSGNEPAGVTYSNATTTTLTINDVDVGMDGWLVRMAIYTNTCNRIFTLDAVIDVEGPITVTNHPDDVSNCAGDEVFFICDYTNPGGGISTTFWQVNDGSGWVNISNASGVYAGITDTDTSEVATDTLTITNVIGLDGNQYRLSIETGTCSTVYSNGATLDVSGNVTFTQEPPFAPINVCAGSDTIIVACASIPQGSFYFTWEYSTDGGATWDSLAIGASAVYDQSSAGATMSSGCDTLIINDATGLEYTWYRAVATANDCNNVESTEARLIVEGPLSVNTDPRDTSICSGDPVEFTALIDNAGDTSTILLYQWQYSPDNSTWIDIAGGVYSGENSNTLVILDVAGLHESYYRMATSTSDCGFIYTASAQLFVEGPITVTANPQDVTLCYNDGATFTSTADPGNSGTLSYQWQVSSDGVNYSDIGATTDGGVYSGYTTTTLTVSSATGLYDRSYRLAFSTGECSRLVSSSAELNVQGEISITTQPVDARECSGDDVDFQVVVSDASPDFAGDTTYLIYQWQENDGSGWVDLANGLSSEGFDGVNGVTSSFLTVFETAGRDDNQFRVLIWTQYCDTLISDAVTLSIEGPLSFTLQPADTSQCEGSGVAFTSTAVNAGLASISYNWQYSDDDGVTWSNLSNGGAYTIGGATTTTLTYATVDTALQDDRIRLAAWTDYCDTIYSDYAQFDVEGTIRVSVDPVDVTACSGDPVCFDITAENDGSGTIFYRWQFSLDGSTWIDLSNSSTYNGTGTNTMCIADISGLDSIQYRARISTTQCAIDYSAAALLVEEGPITFTDHPDDITQCSAEAVTFEGLAAIQAGNSGTLSYQWQESSDGINFTDIVAAGAAGYSGYTTTTLTVTNVAGLNGWNYRLVATTGVCTEVFSFAAVLNVEGPLSVSLQPVDIQNCDDAEALFLSQITNPADPQNLQTEYQWQILLPGGSWEDLTNGDSWNGTNIVGGANSDTLLITPLTDLNGAYVRMKGWTATCDTLTTDSALIAVEGPLTFTDQPDDVTLCSSSSVQFTVAIDNATGVGTAQYQWEVSVNGFTWADITNTGVYTGATTNQLSISNTTGLYNYKYRCKIRTGTCDWTFSTLAQLFVEGPITIDTDLTDQTVCSNVGIILDSEISLPASSSGALNFQWQVSSDSGSSWTSLTDNQSTGTTGSYNGDVTDSGTYFGVTSEDLNISLVEGLNGYMYRILIWTSTCNDTTFEMTLTVQDACLTGTCDFDLDGDDNDTDLDDDNDQLTDVWEDYLTNNNVTDSWFYLEEALGAVSPQGNASSPNLIAYSSCDIDSDNDGFLDNQEDPDGDEINNGEETDGDGVFDGDPLDPCDPILGPTCIGINLAIDIYLQGGHIGNANSFPQPMRSDLREENDFPIFEPYTNIVDSLVPTNVVTPFVHVADGGNEEIDGSGASVLTVSGDDAVVDWVFIELRSSTNLDSVITTRSALLQADGDIVDMDGSSNVSFVNAPAGPYYVVVRHRNHLGIMTAEALDLSPIETVVDFTDPSFATYGDYGQVEVNSETYLWGGDFNANGRTVYQGPFNDINYLFADIIKDQVAIYQDPASSDYDPDYQVIANWIRLGYMRSDINLDGQCIYQGPSNDRAMMLFNTTLSHPLNNGNIANFVIEGILP